MLHPSTKRLIDKLGDMTRRQKVTWQEAEDGRITHDTEGYRVTLTPEPHAVLLTDAQGREIETCSPSDFSDEFDSDGRPYALFVEELYLEAKRHARGAEEAISAVLAGLLAAEAEPDAAPDEIDAAPPPLAEETDETASIEAEIEDPLDDSSPLEPEAYGEMDSQSDITSAVASLAHQVNGQSGEILPEPDMVTGPEEQELVAPGPESDIPSAEQPAETGDRADFAHPSPTDEAVEGMEADETEAPEPETDAPIPPVTGYGIASPDSSPMPDTTEEPGALDEPSAGFTPTAFVATVPEDRPEPEEIEEKEPQVEVATEPDNEFETYTPAFSDAAADAPVYAHAEPFGNFHPETGHAPGDEAVSPDLAEDQPESGGVPQESSLNTSSFLAGGLGAGLNDPHAEPEAAPEQAAAPEQPAHSYEEPDTAEADTGLDTVGEQEQPEPAPEPMPSYSLSGIGARQEPEAAAAPIEADESVESVSAAHIVIDGTNDLPDWLSSESPGTEGDVPAPDMAFDQPDTFDASPVDVAPEPDLALDAQPEPTDADSGDSEASATEETPPRPVKRFNPWN